MAKVSEILSIKSDVEGLKLQMEESTNQSSKPANKLISKVWFLTKGS